MRHSLFNLCTAKPLRCSVWDRKENRVGICGRTGLSLHPCIVHNCQRKYADCRRKTMEILMMAKATKESTATEIFQIQNSWTHWSAHGYKPAAHFYSIFLFSSPPSIMYFGCLYFSLYLSFSKQVWQLNHFCSPVWCRDCSARAVLTGTRPGKTNTQVPEVRISGYQWAATAIWHAS